MQVQTLPGRATGIAALVALAACAPVPNACDDGVDPHVSTLDVRPLDGTLVTYRQDYLFGTIGVSGADRVVTDCATGEGLVFVVEREGDPERPDVAAAATRAFEDEIASGALTTRAAILARAEALGIETRAERRTDGCGCVAGDGRLQ